MIYTKMTKRALAICFEAHKDQVDKAGLPYMFHPFHLAEQMKDEETTIVALLHDVVEDSEYTLDDLRKEGFSDAVLAAVNAMTHEEGVPYMDYIHLIKKNRIATAVKIADLKHNSDSSRLAKIDEHSYKRIEKYKNAISILES